MSDPSISPDRWARIQEVFNAVLDHPEAERPAHLARLCGDDEALRREVGLLLDAHHRGGPVATADLARSDRVLAILRRALAGRYVVEREVATGGMALVFLAQDLKHNRNVAIKVLRPELAPFFGGERFLREIGIAASLQHPHILPLYDSGSAEGLLYYVMPFIEGDTLSDRMQRGGSLPVREAVQIATDILSALEYAHRRGVVHRDIKPSNILLSASGGHAVVADFGIARAVSAAGGDATLTRTGALLGTPGYMPPEQAAGRDVTAESDIYATGIVLYECLTGRQWQPSMDVEKADWTGVPAHCSRVLKRALAWDPGDRWKNATAFRDALLAGAESPRFRRVALGGVVGAALVAAVVAVVTLSSGSVGSSAGPSAARVAVFPFSVRGSGELSYLGEGMVDLLSTKLDGAGNWRSVDPRVLLGTVRRDGLTTLDPQTVSRVAGRLDAGLYVLGSILEVGGRIRLDAALYSVDRRDALARASAEGAPPDVLTLVDDLAQQLLLGQSDAGDARLTRIAAVTTNSLPALKAYLNGVRALRAAQFPQAAAAFQEAVDTDSTFALAWYQLSVSADWLLHVELAHRAAEQAVRFADRLSERDRLLLEALRAARRGEAERSEGLYRAIVGRYPDDVEAWSQLSEVLFHFGPQRGRPLGDSREAWGRVLQLEPDHSPAFVHLARIEVAGGDYAGLDSMAARVIALAPEGDRNLEMHTLRAFTTGDAAERDRVLNMLRRATDDVLSEVTWSAGAFLPDIDAAATVARIPVEPTRSARYRAAGHSILAYYALAAGKWSTAMAELTNTAELDSVAALEHRALLAVTWIRETEPATLRDYRDRLQRLEVADIASSETPGVWLSVHNGVHPHLRMYLVGLLSAALGDEVQAVRARQDLARLPLPVESGSLAWDLGQGIEATLAWRRGDHAEALRALRALRMNVWHSLAVSSPFYGQTYHRFLLASALEEAGQNAEAMRWYRSFDNNSVYDRIYQAPAHLRMGQIAERGGQLEAARSHYERVLSSWADADPALAPSVEAARDGLTRVTQDVR